MQGTASHPGVVFRTITSRDKRRPCLHVPF